MTSSTVMFLVADLALGEDEPALCPGEFDLFADFSSPFFPLDFAFNYGKLIKESCSYSQLKYVLAVKSQKNIQDCLGKTYF